MQTLMDEFPLTTARGDRQHRLRAAGANGCGRNGGENIDHDNIPRDVIDKDEIARSSAPVNIFAGCTRRCGGRNIAK
jgi:hypothetical protein